MARYGSGGKYWNVGLSNFGMLAATERQQFLLQKLTGISHRNRGLTRDQADELIGEAIKEREEKREGLTDLADKLLSSIYKQAIDAANEAGEKWLASHQEIQFVINDPETGTKIGVYGEIGKAWITWPKPTSALYKWLMKEMYDGQKKEIRIPHRYADRLEGELQLACEAAAYAALKRSGSSVGDIRLMYRHEDKSHQAA
ncbi:hypothetical protein [Mesorhizobium sp. SP-1A]|uniref:hypothetical protein n=1 Tax=Mesorhizobium sp. SP-1A TaxID=3077840 RepID=UPI0028F737EE|nr:hypothetical protein [Mesorhizobium sp. SP-1A]